MDFQGDGLVDLFRFGGHLGCQLEGGLEMFAQRSHKSISPLLNRARPQTMRRQAVSCLAPAWRHDAVLSNRWATQAVPQVAAEPREAA